MILDGLGAITNIPGEAEGHGTQSEEKAQTERADVKTEQKPEGWQVPEAGRGRGESAPQTLQRARPC